MKLKVRCALSFNIIGFCSLCADQAVMPDVKEWDLSSIPPSATKMLREDQETHDAQTLSSFKKVVQEIVNQKKRARKKVPRGRGTKSGAKKRATKKLPTALASLLTQQQATFSQDILDVLQKQYEDPELTEKKVSLHLKKMPV